MATDEEHVQTFMRAVAAVGDRYKGGFSATRNFGAFCADIELARDTLREIDALPGCPERDAARDEAAN